MTCNMILFASLRAEQTYGSYFGQQQSTAIYSCSTIWQWSQCLVSTTLGIAGRGWRASATSCKAAESTAGRSQGISNLKRECFPVMYRCRPANVLPLAFLKSATHLQLLLPRVLYPPSVYSSPAPLRSQVLSYVMPNSEFLEIQGWSPFLMGHRPRSPIIFEIRKSLLQ